MQVTILVLDQCNMLSLAAAVDPLRAANRQRGQPLFEWRFTTPGAAPVHLTSGVILPAAPISNTAMTDILIVVGAFEVGQQATPRLCASLRRLAEGALVLGVDGGPWALAKAGLLEGRSATMHWEDIEDFAQSFPQIDVVNARHVTSGTCRTCGGAGPALDMMLGLIRDLHGPELAGKVAAGFIHDPAQPATPQRRQATPQDHTPLTARAERMMEAHVETPLPLGTIARRLGLSPRALQMQFQAALAVTPQAHYLSLRLAEAQRLLLHSDQPVQDIALATGFNSQSSFARAYRAAFGQTATASRINRASDGRGAPHRSRPEPHPTG